jgi:hypothetical protein
MTCTFFEAIFYLKGNILATAGKAADDSYMTAKTTDSSLHSEFHNSQCNSSIEGATRGASLRGTKQSTFLL